jgi:hypothetical protein
MDKKLKSTLFLKAGVPPSTMSLQTLYIKLRSMMLKDPVMIALASHEISWADVCEADSHLEHSFQSHLQEEGGNLIASVLKELGTPIPPVQVHYKTVTYNPANVRTIVVRNLPRDIQMEELRDIFEKHGPTRDIYVPKNTDKNSPYFNTIKGFALIKFLSPMDATRAFMEETTRLFIRGKMIALEFAKEDR